MKNKQGFISVVIMLMLGGCIFFTASIAKHKYMPEPIKMINIPVKEVGPEKYQIRYTFLDPHDGHVYRFYDDGLFCYYYYIQP